MSRNLDVKYFYPETLVIGNGVTALIGPMPGQIGCLVKYGSGGTLYLFGQSTPLGSTFATAQLYRLGATEVYSSDLSGSLALFADGTTTTCYISRAFAQGASGIAGV